MRPVTKITIAGMRLAVIVLAVYWCMIAIGTHLPAAFDFSPRVNDKVKHFGAFMVLTLLLCYSTNSGDRNPGEIGPGRIGPGKNDPFGHSGSLRRHLRRFGTIAVLVLVYAAADEWTQRFVPRRTPDLQDFFADACGMLMGLTIYISAKMILGSRIRQRFYPAS